MEYDEFIDGINTGKIKKAIFSISDYAHYKNCVVVSQLRDPNRPDSLRSIWFYLTADGYEKIGFLNRIHETEKLFDLKKRGRFTLKQIWNRIQFSSIEYDCGEEDTSINS